MNSKHRTQLSGISIVVPVYEEEESVNPLYERIRDACDACGTPYEIVWVDDGSRDGTFDELVRLRAQDPRVKILRFRKNYGQTAAMAAGFEVATGDVVISMDGDLQNDPADITRLLDKMDEGFDVVCGWRKNRQDKLISRKLPSKAANWIIGRVTGVKIHDNGCSLKAYRARVIKQTALYSELHRFIPAMSTITGARIAEIEVRHHSRRFGKSKYGLGRVWKVLLDIITVKMITGFASRPSLWFGLLSLPALGLGALCLLLSVLLFLGQSTEQWLLTSTVGFLLLFLGAHLLSVGFISELAMKTGDYDPARVLGSTGRRLEVGNGSD